MKLNKLVAGLAIAAGALSISSCSEDFEVAAPYKDVTVVYGLLNVDDAAQYIRIQKVFMDENRSALDLAKIADSNYYRNIEVHVKGLNSGNVVFDDVLPRVDMATENLPKNQGTFFDAPSYAYKISRTLNPSYTYRLVIKNMETGNVDSAETSVISTNTGSFVVSLFTGASTKLNFNNNGLAERIFKVSVTLPPNAQYAEGYLRVKYTTKTGNGPQVDSSFIWNFASAALAPSPTTRIVNLNVEQSVFYSILSNNIKPAASDVTRYLDSSDVFIWTANEPFYTYLQVNAAQGGITADQVKTNYTNVKGANVLGLFASRAMRVRYNIPFETATMDSVKNNVLTRPLNFQGFADH